MSRLFVIFATVLMFSAGSVFAGHEVMQGFISAAERTEQKTCADGTVYTKYEQTVQDPRYTIETLVFQSGDILYRMTEINPDSDKPFMEVRRQQAHSGDVPEVPWEEFTRYEPCFKK